MKKLTLLYGEWFPPVIDIRNVKLLSTLRKPHLKKNVRVYGRSIPTHQSRTSEYFGIEITWLIPPFFHWRKSPDAHLHGRWGMWGLKLTKSSCRSQPMPNSGPGRSPVGAVETAGQGLRKVYYIHHAVPQTPPRSAARDTTTGSLGWRARSPQ